MMIGNKLKAAQAVGLLLCASLLLNGCLQEEYGINVEFDRSIQLAGSDMNGNGVRDDIDDYINQQPISERQKRAMTQYAQAIQAMLLVDLADDSAVRVVGHDRLDGMRCLTSRFTKNGKNSADRISKDIEELTVNTKTRAEQQQIFIKARLGSIIRAPKSDTCRD